MTTGVDRIVTRLQRLQTCVITLGRLTALRGLATGRIDEKEGIARQFYCLLEDGYRLSDFLKRYYQVKPELVRWPAAHTPSVRDGESVDDVQLEQNIQSLSAWANATINTIKEETAESALLLPVRLLLQTIQPTIPNASEENLECDLDVDAASSEPARVLCGPQTFQIDPVFTPTYSLTEQSAPAFDDSLEEVVPYFWTLSMREAFASDLCLLNSTEYDGLPIAFHRDMAKQAWDEIRHAQFYLQCSVDLIPEVESVLDEDSWLAEAIAEFKETGSGLAVPAERTLSEAFWNASLTERLILMQFRTEAPAVHRLTEKLQSDLSMSHAGIKEGLKVDRYDERSHARIGSDWLKYLVPDSSRRKAIIQATDEVRPVLLLTSFAQHSQESLGSLVQRYSSGEKVPGEPVYPVGASHRDT